MNHYWFNRQETLQETNEIYSKEKPAKYKSYKRKIKRAL